MSSRLKSLCTTFLPGNREDSPAEHFAKMAKWCDQHQIKHDVYGDGVTIQAFEQKVAELLGFEAGVFVITGTMTQPTVLDLVCRKKRHPVVAMHPSSHIYLHERQGYALQNRFTVLPIGDKFKTWRLADLQQWKDEVSAVLYELPMREIGGQLPSWEELNEIKEYCKQEKIHLHMDGARLWETAAYYQKSYAEIASGFNTAYVSLYKGINGLGGSMLLGEQSFVEEAAVWMKRQGGNVYHRTPYIVSAAMQFDQRLAKMPSFYQRTQEIYKVIEAFPQLSVNPPIPHANMFHLILPFSEKRAKTILEKQAREKGVWYGMVQTTSNPNQSMIEWYVGDYLLEMEDSKLHDLLSELVSG